MLKLFCIAFLLGLIFNAAPGPVFAETIRRGIRGGFHSALAVQVGSLVGDALWAVLGLVGVGLLLQLEALRLPVGIAGAAYLIWLAWETWRSANHELSIDAPRDKTRTGEALRSGILLSVTNPQNIAYWAALGSALGAVGVQEPAVSDYTVFFLGFMASSLAWSVICATLVNYLFCRMGMRWARLTYRTCAIAFLALALSSLQNSCSSRIRHPSTGQKSTAITGTML